MSIFQIFVDNDGRWSTRVPLFLGSEAGEMYFAFVICYAKIMTIFLILCWSVERCKNRHVC